MKPRVIFFISVFTLSAFILYAVFFSGWFEFIPTYTNEIVVMVASTTFIIYVYLLRMRDTNPQLFARFYLLSIALKILAYGGFVFFVVMMDPTNASPNAVLFLITYVLFTALEVLFLVRKS